MVTMNKVLCSKADRKKNMSVSLSKILRFNMTSLLITYLIYSCALNAVHLDKTPTILHN